MGLGALALHTTLEVSGKTYLGTDDFVTAYFFIELISLLSLLFFLRLKTDAGESVSGHQTAKNSTISEKS